MKKPINKTINKLILTIIFSLLISALPIQGVFANGVKVVSKYEQGKYLITLTSQEKGKGLKIIAVSPKNGKTVNVTYSLVKGGSSSATAEISEYMVIAPFRVITTNSDNLKFRPYSDIINTEYDEYVRHLHDSGITAAFSEAKYKPGTAITRAEMASMLALALNLKLDTASKSKYSDVDKHWGKQYINAVVKQGLMSASNGKTFKPNDKVTVADASTVISKAFKFKTNTSGVYTKLKKNQWYSDSVQNVFNLKILTPQDSIYKNFKETNNISRGDFSMMLSRALSTY